MSPLMILGVALGLGWVVVWFLMNQQVKRQSELEKKIDGLEKRIQQSAISAGAASRGMKELP